MRELRQGPARGHDTVIDCGGRHPSLNPRRLSGDHRECLVVLLLAPGTCHGQQAEEPSEADRLHRRVGFEGSPEGLGADIDARDHLDRRPRPNSDGARRQGGEDLAVDRDLQPLESGTSGDIDVGRGTNLGLRGHRLSHLVDPGQVQCQGQLEQLRERDAVRVGTPGPVGVPLRPCGPSRQASQVAGQLFDDPRLAPC